MIYMIYSGKFYRTIESIECYNSKQMFFKNIPLGSILYCIKANHLSYADKVLFEDEIVLIATYHSDKLIEIGE